MPPMWSSLAPCLSISWAPAASCASFDHPCAHPLGSWSPAAFCLLAFSSKGACTAACCASRCLCLIQVSSAGPRHPPRQWRPAQVDPRNAVRPCRPRPLLVPPRQPHVERQHHGELHGSAAGRGWHVRRRRHRGGGRWQGAGRGRRGPGAAAGGPRRAAPSSCGASKARRHEDPPDEEADCSGGRGHLQRRRHRGAGGAQDRLCRAAHRCAHARRALRTC